MALVFNLRDPSADPLKCKIPEEESMINQIKHLSDKLYFVRCTDEYSSDVLKVVKIYFWLPSISVKVVKTLEQPDLYYLKKLHLSKKGDIDRPPYLLCTRHFNNNDYNYR